MLPPVQKIRSKPKVVKKPKEVTLCPKCFFWVSFHPNDCQIPEMQFRRACRNFLLLIALFQSSLSAQSLTEDTPIPNDVVIEAKANPGDDLIQKRLEKIFSAVESLREVEVKVEEGVTTLSGTAANATASLEARKLASKMEGVIYVNDEMDEDVEVQSRLLPSWDRLRHLGQKTLRKLPLIGVALIAIFLFYLLGKLVSKALELAETTGLTRRFGLNELSSSLLRRVVRLLFLGVGIFTALEILDATAIASALLGVAGVAGLALGFAFRNIVENYLAGVLLSLRNPFSSGDAIEINGFTGKVVRLTSRDTVMMSAEGNHIRIPNSTIMTSPLTNFSRNPLRRFDFTIGVSTELNLVAVRKKGLETLAGLESILADPPPLILIEALGDSAVNLRFFAWVDQRKNDFLKSKSEAIRLMKRAFDEAGFEMPEPIYRVRMREESDKKESVPAKENLPAGLAQTTEANEEADTSIDDSIDQQLETARRTEGEPDLLSEGS